MSAAGLRLRLCPFCGSEAGMIHSGIICVVKCRCCGAEGPVGDIAALMEYDDGLTDETVWEKRKRQAEGAAIRGWNGRPHYGSMFPDELERFEKESEIYWDESEL